MSARPKTNGAEWTIGRLLSWTTDHLSRHGIEEPRLSSEVLLAHAADCRRIDLYARFDSAIDAGRLDTFRALVKRAATAEPIAYLVGQKEFFSLSFQVETGVLIPRPETETLVEVAAEHCSKRNLAGPDILDLGTGSGCIAVALLAQIAGAHVVATDVSRQALETAAANAERHGVSERFRAVEADRLALPGDAVPAGGFDLLLSNPPYVSRQEMDGLAATVGRFEPPEALAGGEDGLDFYRCFAAGAAGLLSADGIIIVEVGDDQAPAVVEIMTEAGAFAHEGTWKDRVVGRDRVLMFSRR